jgi:hypothetical protein
MKPCFQAASPSLLNEPRVAMLCPVRGEKRNKIFQNKFLTPEGKTERDRDKDHFRGRHYTILVADI